MSIRAGQSQGRITQWNDDRGFGFITPLEGGADVFVHVSEFPRDLRRPEVLDLVTYDIRFDEARRPRATSVRFMAPTRSIARGRVFAASWAIGLVVAWFSMFALLALAYPAALGVLAFTFAMSFISYLAYGIDKNAAEHHRWRTREATLHLIDAMGGWPGGLVAQKVFHHKTIKAEFQGAFWTTVALDWVVVVGALYLASGGK